MKVKLTSVAATAAVLTAIATLLMLLSGSDKTRLDQINEEGTTCTVIGKNNEVDCTGQIPKEKLDEDALLREHARMVSEGLQPEGAGPWPFVVTRDDGNIGLKVRTTPFVEATHIGGLGHLQTAYVICKFHSGFDPEGNGDLWYKVKWDNKTKSQEFFQSYFNAKSSGWAHGYYLTPYKHNGDVPTCPTPKS